MLSSVNREFENFEKHPNRTPIPSPTLPALGVNRQIAERPARIEDEPGWAAFMAILFPTIF
jgi:hypothetical protein